MFELGRVFYIYIYRVFSLEISPALALSCRLLAQHVHELYTTCVYV